MNFENFGSGKVPEKSEEVSKNESRNELKLELDKLTQEQSFTKDVIQRAENGETEFLNVITDNFGSIENAKEVLADIENLIQEYKKFSA